MANKLDNLIPFNEMTENEQRTLASKGGKASAEARRKKATMLSVLENLLDEIPENAKNPNNLSYREMATLGLIKGAVNGSSKN